jgi:hypothetical protein
MPYLGGGNLSDLVARHGPLPPERVTDLVPQLASALAAAHRLGIVHRDVKPSNVLFDDRGKPFLADFGIASTPDATAGLTVTGTLVGTPEFMSPEQARGEAVTPASDMFSLGATLAFAATGSPPYGRGDPWVLIQRAARGRIQPLPATLPSGLRHRLASMLEKNPRHRPSAVATGDGSDDTQVLRVVGARSRSWVATHRAWTAAMLVTAIAAIIVAATIATVSGLLSTQILHGDETGAATTAPTVAQPSSTTTTSTCADQQYQPCGRPVAAFTDGQKCLDDHEDYDHDATNGCEAAPDDRTGKPFDGTITANLVPAGNVDEYRFTVKDDRFPLGEVLCEGRVKVTLTAPKGATMRLDVLRGSRTLANKTSSDGKAETATIKEACFADDSGELTARVSWTSDPRRTGDSYRLERTGSF